MSRILFLGTAGSLAVASKGLRSSGGIILQVDELQFHIDPGPGALRQAALYGVNLHHTTTILVSHAHLNHCNDVNVVIDAMTHSGIEQRGILLASKSLLQHGDGMHPFISPHYQNLLEKIIPLEKNRKIGIELMEINALSAEHTDDTAIGFKFLCPKFTLSYSGDTAYTAQLAEEMSGSDVLILNVPYPGNRAAEKNLDTDAAIRIISHVRPKLAIITHFGVEMLKADPLEEARTIQRITGVQTLAAKDGLSLVPEGTGMEKSPVKGYS